MESANVSGIYKACERNPQKWADFTNCMSIPSFCFLLNLHTNNQKLELHLLSIAMRRFKARTLSLSAKSTNIYKTSLTINHPKSFLNCWGRFFSFMYSWNYNHRMQYSVQKLSSTFVSEINLSDWGELIQYLVQKLVFGWEWFKYLRWNGSIDGSKISILFRSVWGELIQYLVKK